MATKEWWDSVISPSVPVTRTELRDYLRTMERTPGIPIPYVLSRDIPELKPDQWRRFLDAWIKNIYKGSDSVPFQNLDLGIRPSQLDQIKDYVYGEACKKYNRKPKFIQPKQWLEGDFEETPERERIMRELQQQIIKEFDKFDPQNLFELEKQRLEKMGKQHNFLDDPMLQNILQQPIQGPRFNRTPIAPPPPPPEQVIIQYIGGPKNGEQEYFHWPSHPYIQQGNIYTVKLDTPLVMFDGDNLKEIKNEVAQYKLTFIPMQETPFSDAQIAIGIFQ